MGRGVEKRRRWFDHGAGAIARVTEGEVAGYVCPLCRRLFTDVEELTFEHAPPRKLGGKTLALTCRECNSKGSKLDAAMRHAEDLLDWGRGTSQKPIRARATVLGLTVNVETERRDGGPVTIVGLPDRNHPSVTEKHIAALDALVALPAPEQTFSLTFHRHKHLPSHVQAGWLRAAYLAAFAKFGYRYALRPLMEPVRAQIADPTGNHLNRFILHGSSSPPTARMMLQVARPRSMRSLAVGMGSHLVFLPGMEADSDTLYERLVARARWPLSRSSLLSLQGTNWGWPTSPELALDFV